MTLKIATWNINGIKARLDQAVSWVSDMQPDILCFQEIKTITEAFPARAFEDLGYNLAVHGQKGFHGVALLSKLPLEDVKRGLPGEDSDEQARFIEGVVSVPCGAVRVVSLYLPNGNPVGSEKFEYKLRWIARLKRWALEHMEAEEIFTLAGDFNVIPEPRDAEFPNNWVNDALYQPESRRAFRDLNNIGLTDAVRAINDGKGIYTYWDYQAGAWQRNNGIRIDHQLLSPQAADRLVGVAIDSRTRSWDKPSDHVPVIVELDVEKR
ncbi:MAG: exodeoxyribonuclease III [Alphaproteobacteria bacterium]